MPLRTPTLEEWFLAYQLSWTKRDHFHLPFSVDVDVSRLCAYYREQKKRLPITSLLIKAAGLFAERFPEANRVVFQTPWGMRILEPHYVAVNVPILLQEGGGVHLSGAAIREPQLKSVQDVRSELRRASERSIEELPVGRHVYNVRNTFLNRMRLKGFVWGLKMFPQLYEKFGGGGISVSSVMHHASPDFPLQVMAYGPTAVTLCVGHVSEEQGKERLKLAYGFDHYAFNGSTGMRLSKELAFLLQASDDEDFQTLVR